MRGAVTVRSVSTAGIRGNVKRSCDHDVDDAGLRAAAAATAWARRVIGSGGNGAGPANKRSRISGPVASSTDRRGNDPDRSTRERPAASTAPYFTFKGSKVSAESDPTTKRPLACNGKPARERAASSRNSIDG